MIFSLTKATHGPKSRGKSFGRTLAPRPEFCCLCVLFAHAQAPSYCVLFAPAQAPSNSGSYYIEENEMNCEGSSEYMIMFMSFTRASFLTYGRFSHPVG